MSTTVVVHASDKIRCSIWSDWTQAVLHKHTETVWTFSALVTENSTFVTEIHCFEHKFLQRRLFFMFKYAIIMTQRDPSIAYTKW